MQNTKAIVLSKIVWVNLILSLLAVIDLVQASPVIPPEVIPYLALGAGVLNIILRIWFTDQPLRGLFK